MSGTGTRLKTGSYAVTTVYSMPWSKKKKKATTWAQSGESKAKK